MDKQNEKLDSLMFCSLSTSMIFQVDLLVYVYLCAYSENH